MPIVATICLYKGGTNCTPMVCSRLSNIKCRCVFGKRAGNYLLGGYPNAYILDAKKLIWRYN